MSISINFFRDEEILAAEKAKKAAEDNKDKPDEEKPMDQIVLSELTPKQSEAVL